jgi:RNA polymerase sigma-70 factor, ECF subfamily
MDTVVVVGDVGPRPLGGEAVEAAYGAFSTEIRGRLLGLVRDPAEAEDLAQEAFLRLHREAAAGRLPDNPRAWLHRVAGNLATSRGRRLKVAVRYAPRLASGAGPSTPEEIALRHDGEARLAVALTGLAPHERRVLLLAAAGLTGQEIGWRIGRTEVATRTLLCRARSRLRARVEALEAANDPRAGRR